MYLHILHITYLSIILKLWMKWKKEAIEFLESGEIRIIGGQKAESHSNLEETSISSPIYKEHNNEYLLECIENLAGKGIKLDIYGNIKK